jgi:hypothetical protein
MKPCREEFRVDLRQVVYGDWLAFVFDHPVALQGESEWYFQTGLEVEADPVRQVTFLARLFREPDGVAERFTSGQIAQGFWFMFGDGGGEWFRDLLWEPSVHWEARRACIELLPELYARLFERCALDTIPFMLPDLLAFGYESGLRNPNTDEEDRRAQQALFEAFRRMLDSHHSETLKAALHGLHHLAHPGGSEAIQGWLDVRTVLPAGARSYAEDVLAGRVQ